MPATEYCRACPLTAAAAVHGILPTAGVREILLQVSADYCRGRPRNTAAAVRGQTRVTAAALYGKLLRVSAQHRRGYPRTVARANPGLPPSRLREIAVVLRRTSPWLLAKCHRGRPCTILAGADNSTRADSDSPRQCSVKQPAATHLWESSIEQAVGVPCLTTRGTERFSGPRESSVDPRQCTLTQPRQFHCRTTRGTRGV